MIGNLLYILFLINFFFQVFSILKSMHKDEKIEVTIQIEMNDRKEKYY